MRRLKDGLGGRRGQNVRCCRLDRRVQREGHDSSSSSSSSSSSKASAGDGGRRGRRPAANLDRKHLPCLDYRAARLLALCMSTGSGISDFFLFSGA
jgi:hypothetical protein